VVKFRVARLEDVPEALRGEYQPGADGGFELRLDEGDHVVIGRPDLEKIKGSLAAARRDVGEREKRLADFADLDAKIARDAIRKVAEMKNWTPEDKVREQIAAQVQSVKDEYGRTMKTREEREAFLMREVERLVVDSGIDQAIIDDDPKNSLHLLRPIVRQHVRALEEKTGFRQQVFDPRTNAPRMSADPKSTGEMTTKELMAELKRDERYAAAFPGRVRQGSGMSPSDGGSGIGTNGYTLTREEAKDIGRYERARAEAHKAGTSVEIVS
jgi:hypothetical protein